MQSTLNSDEISLAALTEASGVTDKLKGQVDKFADCLLLGCGGPNHEIIIDVTKNWTIVTGTVIKIGYAYGLSYTQKISRALLSLSKYYLSTIKAIENRLLMKAADVFSETKALCSKFHSIILKMIDAIKKGITPIEDVTAKYMNYRIEGQFLKLMQVFKATQLSMKPFHMFMRDVELSVYRSLRSVDIACLRASFCSHIGRNYIEEFVPHDQQNEMLKHWKAI